MNFIKKLWKDLPQYGIMIVKCDNIAKSIGSGSMQYSFSKKEISSGVEL